MGKSQRTKGASSERELAHLLQNELGIVFERNLHQYQEAGGFDLAPKEGQPQVGYLIEVKRREEERLDQWWREACDHAQGKPCMVFYRRSRQPWRVLVDLHDLAPNVFCRRGSPAIVSFADACTLLRESAR